MEILRKSQHDEYIGEPISQLEHALQAAHFARKMNASNEAILACLLHDLGHLCADKSAPQMDGLGVVNHENIGGDFLRQLGFNPKAIDLIENHVQAKRYLCLKNPAYLKHLSEASRGTLNFQGGPMTEAQAAAYEAHPYFNERILVRRCDEMAKQVDLEVADLDSYHSLLLSALD